VPDGVTTRRHYDLIAANLGASLHVLSLPSPPYVAAEDVPPA